jgi:hypothetical protein
MSYDPGSSGDRPQHPGHGQGWPGGQQYPGGYGQQPPPNPGWGGQQQPPAGMPTQLAPGERSGFAALFDFSFTSFATPSLIRLLYIVGTVLIGLYYVGMVIAMFTTSSIAGVLTLVFGAVVALFMLAFLRLSLEFYFAVVRMSEDIHNRH